LPHTVSPLSAAFHTESKLECCRGNAADKNVFCKSAMKNSLLWKNTFPNLYPRSLLSRDTNFDCVALPTTADVRKNNLCRIQ
jgi:hypothetical protein